MTAAEQPDRAARRAAAMKAAGQVLADARARIAASTAREAAEAAFVPGGPSVEELELKIRALRERARQRAAAEQRVSTLRRAS